MDELKYDLQYEELEKDVKFAMDKWDSAKLRIAALEAALEAFVTYPDVKGYVGSIVFNAGVDALDSKPQEPSQHPPTPVSPHIE